MIAGKPNSGRTLKAFARRITGCPTNFRAGWFVAVLATILTCAESRAAIDDARYVELGGVEQWIQIRGQDESNPVLLWLNGGPGGSTIPDTPAFAPWEEHFTMVMWDQRGEGKTFEKHGRSLAETMTIERMRQDGIELAEYLKMRIPEAKIVLLGHSWGSILGIHMIRCRPDLFAAYVGTGQVTSLPRQFEAAYPLLLERAEELNNEEAKQALLSAGPPSVSNTRAYAVVNRWGDRLEPPPPSLPNSSSNSPSNATPSSSQNEGIFVRLKKAARAFWQSMFDGRPNYIEEGRRFSVEVIGPYLQTVDLPALGTDFEVPVFFFQGNMDFITTTSVVLDYYEEITAPEKDFVTFPTGGHYVIFRVRIGFLNELVERVKPVASR